MAKTWTWTSSFNLRSIIPGNVSSRPTNDLFVPGLQGTRRRTISRRADASSRQCLRRQRPLYLLTARVVRTHVASRYRQSGKSPYRADLTVQSPHRWQLAYIGERPSPGSRRSHDSFVAPSVSVATLLPLQTEDALFFLPMPFELTERG